MRTLDRGGSLIDAMISTSATLSVVLQQATSLGGDAFFLYHDAEKGNTIGLNATGYAPDGATSDYYKDGIPDRGPNAVSVPGMVRGWERLHERYGKLPWEELFGDAIDAAEAHPSSRVLTAGLDLFRDDVMADPACHALYFDDAGNRLQAGDILRQPALADTLRRIAAERSVAYYEGDIAKSIGDYIVSNGGLLGADQFAGYEPEWVEPLGTNYRGYTVQVMPPNSYGMLMLLQLNGLSALSSEQIADNDTDRLDYLIRAMQGAFTLGQPYISDPRVVDIPVDHLLGDETSKNLQDCVVNGTNPSTFENKGGTSCIVIADGDGNAMSVVQSVFHVFGSAFMDPGTGILMNNRMTGFRVDETDPRNVAPRKRPSHTLNPVMVLKDGKPKYLMTTPGGPGQTLSMVQVLTNLVDRGMELTTAIESPRWSVGLDGSFMLEDGYPAEIAEELGRRGHEVKHGSGASYFGSAKTIEILDNGVLTGGADTRREASAVGR
ncbi:MAG: gamma-glutamyltransferase family protein [Pseudomonadota bacterium]|nr:gamma-glutamyltransferase family protein [Pseudomonadota bacterium]